MSSGWPRKSPEMPRDLRRYHSEHRSLCVFIKLNSGAPCGRKPEGRCDYLERMDTEQRTLGIPDPGGSGCLLRPGRGQGRESGECLEWQEPRMDRGLLKGSKIHTQLRVEATPTLERLPGGWYSTALVMVWARSGRHDLKGKIKWLWLAEGQG